MSKESPRKLGKYELRERLGRGGMAEVWKALDTQLQRYVAIKLLHTNLQSDANFVSRFQREAQVIASLQHPNIVQIHDFQVEQAPPDDDPIFYMVMAYIEGQTLADYIASTSVQGKIPAPVELVNLFTSISLAVDYAHQKGMIHRDLKPANILLDQRNRSRNPMGEPILTDFGLAKLLGGTAVTLAGVQMGTPLYTSPEQARGHPGNERSDLYSLGVILYELVTGTAPFRADTPTAVLAQHLFATPPSPVLLNPHIPPALTMVIMTALAKDPGARFARATTMATAIAEALHVPVPESLGQSAFTPDVSEMPTYVSQLAFPTSSGSGASPFSSPLDAPSAPAQLLSGPASQGSTPSQDVRAESVAADASGPTLSAPMTPSLWIANAFSEPGAAVVASEGTPGNMSQAPVQNVAPSPLAGSSGSAALPALSSRSSGQIDALSTPASSAGLHSPLLGASPNSASFALNASVPPAPSSFASDIGKKRGWRGLYTVLLVLLVLLVLGGGVGSYLAFFHPIPPPISSGGLVAFVSSGQLNPDSSAQGIADELSFSLQHVPAPQAGQSYYAWLLADRQPGTAVVGQGPQPQFTLPLKIGPLPYSNGSINYLYPGTPAHDDLFSLASRLLITEEHTSGPQMGPAANRAAWRYYAEIPQTLYGTPPLSALNHIRPLFYGESTVLSLPGGLDAWLFHNTEKVFEWAVSARDDYSSTMTNSGVIHGLFGDMLEYLDGSPNVSVDAPPHSVINPDPVGSRVALLSVTPAQQQGTDLASNPPGYLDQFAAHLNGVVQAPDATSQTRLLCTQMIEALNNASGWLQQVRSDVRQLVRMNADQLSRPSTLLLLDRMLQYATYAYVGQLDPKTDQVVPGVLQVHDNVQKLATLSITTTLPQRI